MTTEIDIGSAPASSSAHTPAFDSVVRDVVDRVCRQPLQREILYKTLGFCRSRRALGEVEAEIATYPEFEYCAQDQFHLISLLVDAAGLELLELDGDGIQVTPGRKAGLSEDEVDDLVVSFALVATPAGCEARERLDRRGRIAALLDRGPAEAGVFMALLEICRDPRAYEELEALVTVGDAWSALEGDGGPEDDGSPHPSYFIGELEKAGAIVWTGAWALSDEGRELLQSADRQT